MPPRPPRPPGSRRSPEVGLGTIAREWGRIGCIGFGGPPAHISLLRKRCVTERRWLTEEDFEDGVAATNLLPGPASTQLAIYCAWRLRGWQGALVGGVCFIVPGLLLILVLAALFLRADAPELIRGAAAGAGAAVPAVAVHAAVGLLPGSWRRAHSSTPARARWVCLVAAGAAGAAFIGPWLVLVLAGAGLLEIAARSRPRSNNPPLAMVALPATPAAGAIGNIAGIGGLSGIGGLGGLGAVSWVALKVGLLSYGGGFVIIPLMQHDAVQRYGWMTDAQFLTAVALGQITPGPVLQTVAVVGYAAAGIGGGLLAATVAFTPSFVMVLLGGRRFERLRANSTVQCFLTGAGASAIGAIAGSAIPIGLALAEVWQIAVLGAAGMALASRRAGVVAALLGSAAIGALAALAGAPLSQ